MEYEAWFFPFLVYIKCIHIHELVKQESGKI